ncbi:MAG: orotate phosphoribosyltransferase [Planctomycetes bacterium]|nr:orotate phosphoribosyltransferase [Planctomycetota bacterium]
MEDQEVLRLLKESDALLEGHFELSSGNRSDRYVQCALVLQHPARAGLLGVALGEKFQEERIDVVVGPAMGGIIIAHEVARFLGARCLFTERVEGKMTLRRGFIVKPEECALVVEDVVTTGGSALEVVEVLRKLGVRVAGVGCIVDRTRGAEVFDVPFRALAQVDAQVWTPAEDPLARQGSVPVKPGSRALSGRGAAGKA